MIFGFRTLLLVIGVIVISLIIIDGIRRIKKQQKLNAELDSYRHDNDAPDPLFSEESVSSAVVITAPKRERLEPVLSEQTADDVNEQISSEEITSEMTDIQGNAPEEKEVVCTLPNVVILNVMAMSGQSFDGPNVLQALLSSGLRHGDMSIFHCYDDATEPKTVQFSVASAVEPGIFVLSAMGSFQTPGLSLFFTPKNVLNPLKTFDVMLSTAEKLADRLEGSIYDATRKILTEHQLADIRASLASHRKITPHEQVPY